MAIETDWTSSSSALGIAIEKLGEIVKAPDVNDALSAISSIREEMSWIHKNSTAQMLLETLRSVEAG